VSRRTRAGRRAAVVAGGALAAVVVTAALAGARWTRASARAAADLDDGIDHVAVSEAELARRIALLPPPVRRYLAYALPPGQRRARRVRITQAGEFTLRPGVWSGFHAAQELTARRRGFAWDASIRLVPMLAWPTVRVRDHYANGVGAMRGAVAGLVPVVDQAGTPQMAEASLQRYLAEAAWLPTALLPDESLVWTPIDQRAARATLTDRGVVAHVDFLFGASGEIVGTETERFRDGDGPAVRTRWVGHFGDYARVEGMMVPRSGAVEWSVAGRAIPYFRARVTRFEYTWSEVERPR
jgi:hypothetical protein